MVRGWMVVLFLFSILHGSSPTLSPGQVRDMMNQLFAYHVEYKQMNETVAIRSLEMYLSQFDANKHYFLAQEIQGYLHPTASLITTIRKDYDNDCFATYHELDQLIISSIHRARSWRQEWTRSPEAWVREATQITHRLDIEMDYPSHIAQLQERYRRFCLAHLRMLTQDVDPDRILALAPRLVQLQERQLAEHENGYLGLTGLGQTSSYQEQQHAFTLRILKALAHSLDAHTAYFSPEEALAMKVQLEKGMCGIGVVLREGAEGIVIHEMVQGGPAALSGELEPGDRIIAIDGQAVQDYPFRKILDIMKGKEGAPIQLGVFKKKEQATKTVRLVRSRIAISEQRVDYDTVPFADGMIGVIKVPSFYEGSRGVSTEEDVKKAIEELEVAGPLYGIILDMRDNSGGFLSQAVKVSGLFISNGVVVVSKYSDGTMKYYRSMDGKRIFDRPLVVLVSKGSASATEIVAQALQDYGVAVVVGDEKTYGKGTIQHQTVTDAESSSFFKVTVGRYYTVSGRSTQVTGVKSDIVVPTALHRLPIGEGILEYALDPDAIPASYEDPLSDVDPFAKKWFHKNYLPHLQKREMQWVEYLPTLKENSEYRLRKNQNFQVFLSELESTSVVKSGYGQNDLQLEESVEILKDMIFLSR